MLFCIFWNKLQLHTKCYRLKLALLSQNDVTMFQGEFCPCPFQHVYKQNGKFISDKLRQTHTQAIMAAVQVCKPYILEMFSWYLDAIDFDTVDKYTEYIEGNPDGMELLAVMLTARLNRVHLCVHHPKGEWHTHVPGNAFAVCTLPTWVNCVLLCWSQLLLRVPLK